MTPNKVCDNAIHFGLCNVVHIDIMQKVSVFIVGVPCLKPNSRIGYSFAQNLFQKWGTYLEVGY